MANAGVKWIGKPAGLVTNRNESWIDCNANDVVPGRHYRLSVTTVENEILTAELPNIGVRPALAYALISRNAWSSAAQKLAVVVIWAGVSAILLKVNHAEPAFSRTPDLSRHRIDQFIKRVVTEVEMIVTGREFVQSVIDVVVRVTEREVGVAYVWRRHGEAQQRMRARRNTALLHAAKARRQVFNADDPMLAKRRLVNYEIGQICWWFGRRRAAG